MGADELYALMRAVGLHDEWCDNAKQAIESWGLIGRRLGVMRDVRMMIARMVWEERCVWRNASKC
jgi:hypothetical protein